MPRCLIGSFSLSINPVLRFLDQKTTLPFNISTPVVTLPDRKMSALEKEVTNYMITTDSASAEAIEASKRLVSSMPSVSQPISAC